jgi:hypothetical protein
MKGALLTRRFAVAVLFVCVLGAVFAGSTSASSILYKKGGRLWVASGTGTHKHAIEKTRGLSNPSQDDRGRIVAQKGVKLYRLSRRGKRLNKPITTAFRTNPVVPSFKGPFFPEVSPNGKLIAYTYSFTEAHYDPGCDCVSYAPSLNTAYTYSNRFVDDPDAKFGHMRFYSRGSWIGNSSFVAATPNLYDYAGNVLDTLAVDPLGGGADSYDRWFTECTDCSSVLTLQKYPLEEPEVTRARDKAVVVAGDLNTTQAGSMLFVYPLAAPPTAIPPRFCRITGANGSFTSPSWSPDGNSLAWADRSGVWVGKLGSTAGDECEVSRKLVVKGGSAPDWGPARP